MPPRWSTWRRAGWLVCRRTQMEATFLRHSWRAHWRSLLVLALLVGLTGGLTIAGLAGARRSMTSLERFEEAARTLDVFINADVTTPEPPAMAELLDGPLVEDVNDLVYMLVEDEFGAVFARTSRRGLDIERGVLLEGRRADPDAPDEVVLSEASARALAKTRRRRPGAALPDARAGRGAVRDRAAADIAPRARGRSARRRHRSRRLRPHGRWCRCRPDDDHARLLGALRRGDRRWIQQPHGAARRSAGRRRRRSPMRSRTRMAASTCRA